MANYLGLPGSVASNPTVSAGTAINGTKQCDVRFEIAHTAVNTRVLSEAWGVFYAMSRAGEFLSLQIYDGTVRTFNKSGGGSYGVGVWHQIKMVADWTANPALCDFYERDHGPDLDDETGWSKIGATIEIAASIGAMSSVQNGWTIGGASYPLDGGIRKWMIRYDSDNKTYLDDDVSNLSPAELGAGEFVGDDGLTYVLNGDEWAYVCPSCGHQVLAGPGQLLRTGG